MYIAKAVVLSSMIETGGIKLHSVFSTDMAKGEQYKREVCQPCGRQTKGRSKYRKKDQIT